VSRYDWLLFLHLIGAFAAMGSVVVFSVLFLGGDRIAAPQLTFLGRRLWDVGGLLTLVFGVWLALDDYSIVDGWILIALVPVVGGLIALVFNGFIAGTPGPNRFGNPPGRTLATA